MLRLILSTIGQTHPALDGKPRLPSAARDARFRQELAEMRREARAERQVTKAEAGFIARLKLAMGLA